MLDTHYGMYKLLFNFPQVSRYGSIFSQIWYNILSDMVVYFVRYGSVFC